MVTTVGLSTDRVNEIFKACVAKEPDQAAPDIQLAGFAQVEKETYLVLSRVEYYRDDIVAMLRELSGKFRTGDGGGGGDWFANALVDQHDHAWTTDKRTADRLFMLGKMLGLVRFNRSHFEWPLSHLSPDGLPFVRIDL